jgi:anti-sigma factor RsiW
MKNEQSILIWKYLDGECTPQEKEQVQHLLVQDAAFAEELEIARSLQETLQGLEPEQPSMRFGANVTEKLPALYRPIHTSADILPKGLVRIFGSLVATVAVLSLGLFFAGQGVLGQSFVVAQREINIMGHYTVNLGVFSNPMVFSAFLVSLAVLSYFLMDFALKKWILKK